MNSFIYICLFGLVIAIVKIIIDYFYDIELTKNFKPDNIIVRYKVTGVKFMSEDIIEKWKIIERVDKYIFVEDVNSQERAELNIENITKGWDKLEIIKDEKVIETFTSNECENY